MAASSNKKADSPLLGGSTRTSDQDFVSPLSKTTQTAIKALSVIRIATGAACLVAPRFTCALFQYKVPAEHVLLVRMFGIRDAVLGELLITAENKERQDQGRREIKRALWAGVATDVVDVGSVVAAVSLGQIGRATGGLLGAFAVAAIGLGVLGLRGL